MAGEQVAGKAYRTYVLVLLMIIYAFNFLDRQVVTIIAPYLKADMGVSDAQIGLLFGTAFALFYAVFGLPLAKLADGWNRVRTISIGLGFWSFMTAISGFTSTFGQLGSARIGVGVGRPAPRLPLIRCCRIIFQNRSARLCSRSILLAFILAAVPR